MIGFVLWNFKEFHTFAVYRLLFLPFPVITSVVQVLSPHSWIFVCFLSSLTGGFLVDWSVGF